MFSTIKEIDLSPAELKAIEDHKYFMSQKQGQEVSIEDAIKDFVSHYKDTWIKEKQKKENYEQLEEIKKYMQTRSQEAGYTLSENDAAEEWMGIYAHIWRQEKESLQENGFLSTQTVVQNAKGLHMRPSSTLATLTSKFDCDVYVHKDGMEHYNFILNGKKYMNVKSVLGILTLAACKGEALEFIATGKDAEKAIKAIEVFVNNGCKTCV
ncbi:MAG: HPr family phosphocarrier protein [Spirochaetales bacterium]|nr:HPr family phosphocarrier protein [Spirochaetales bacterium]